MPYFNREPLSGMLGPNIGKQGITNTRVNHLNVLTFQYSFFTDKYKNRRCDMIVHETAIQQTTVKSNLIQVPLWHFNNEPKSTPQGKL